MGSRFITRVQLRNYKSIAACDVGLDQLTFLVGPNGSGKSNFLDAIRFVSDALRTSLDHALRDRGGVAEVRRRSTGHPNHFAVRLDFDLDAGSSGHYSFRIAARERGGYEVQTEECSVSRTEALSPHAGTAYFSVRRGKLESSIESPPARSADRLYLVNVSGYPQFRPAFDALSTMGFYNLNPQKIRDLQSPDPGDLLQRDGGNITGVLSKLQNDNPKAVERIEEYLNRVTPDVAGVSVKTVGPKETLEFRQKVGRNPAPWRFTAANMSDGTLRALGVLVAIFQFRSRNGGSPPFVGIEEPEVALHPGAAGVLFDSLVEASEDAQIVLTSHSPDLLDNENLRTEWILAVSQQDGATQIAPVDEASRSAVADGLYTPGELLRMNQIAPDPAKLPTHNGAQLRLFEYGEQ